MNKQKSKQAESEEMPEDWQVIKLGSTGKVVTGKTPSTKNQSYWGGSIPFVTPTDIGYNKLQENTERKITELGVNECNEIPAGSLMVTCIASIGKNAISKERCCTNQQINSIIPNEKNSVDYLYYYVEKIKPRLEILAGKTAVPILNKSDFEKVLIAKPELPEQQRIASVLSCVDSAIQQTDEVIEQARQLKKGLMQELLTRGIGHKKFKETEIGEIPEEWGLVTITEVCKINPRDDLSSLNADTDVSFIPMEAVTEDALGTIQTRIARYKDVQKGYTPLGESDILFAKITPCMENGKIAIARNLKNKIGFGSTEFYILRPIDKVSPEWVFYWVARPEFRKFATTYFTGTGGQQRVNRKYFDDTKIPVPPANEQPKIVSIFSSVDSKINSEFEKRSQLVKLKKGLMQDLLTGRVRFPEFVKGGS